MMTGTDPNLELLSIDAFARLPDDECRMELVRGHVVREPLSGFRHGRIAVRIASILDRFVREHDLGVVGVDTGFVLADEPPTVRGPDVAFVARERLPSDPIGFAPLAPDLAVEILSPSNTIAQIEDKVTDYLDAGVRLVWIVNARSESVTVYRSRRDMRLLLGEDEIDGADVLPGFSIPVGRFFER